MRFKPVLAVVMGLLYVAAGVNHFVNTDFYVSIMPRYVPWHRAMVWISGVAEVVLGVAVMVPRTRRLAGWGIIALLVAVFPANLHMALAGPGAFDVAAWVLWARLPLQGLLILWAWWVTRP